MKEMAIFDHIVELRTRLIRAVIAIVGMFAIALFFSNQILEFLKVPLLKSLPAGTSSRAALHFTSPTDVFVVSLQVSFLAAVVVGAPFWLYQFWKFVEPALYANEKRKILPFAVSSIAFFWIGMLFCYFGMLPVTMQYLIGVGTEVGTPMITITEYVSLVNMLFLGFGLVFETPLVLVLLALLGILSATSLKEFRRYAIVVILLVAAILTPSPDILSQIIMAIPMYLLYELSIFIIARIERKQNIAIQP